MIDVPGAEKLSSSDGVLYLAPMPTGSKAPAPKTEWPRVFSKGVVFSLTAWNPEGVDAPAAYNEEANKRLETDISELRVEPRAWWHSFGFNEREGWREEGFSVAFATEERLFARQAMLKLAKKHRQAALYAYAYDKAENTVVRELIWVNYQKHQAHTSKERMTVLSKPPSSPLARRGRAAREVATDAAAGGGSGSEGGTSATSSSSEPPAKRPRWRIWLDTAWEPKPK